jgi:hypothetical protein
MKILAVTITGIIHDAEGSRSVSGNWSHGMPIEDLIEARDIINRFLEGSKDELVVATASQQPLPQPQPK